MRNVPLPKISTLFQNKHISQNKHIFEQNVLIINFLVKFVKSFTLYFDEWNNGKIENFSSIIYRNQKYSRISSDVHISLILALGVSLKVKSSRQTQLDPAENSPSEKT